MIDFTSNGVIYVKNLVIMLETAPPQINTFAENAAVTIKQRIVHRPNLSVSIA